MRSNRGGELRCYMNLMALDSLPDRSSHFEQNLARIRSGGFTGVQFADFATPEQLSACRAAGLGITGSGRVNTPAETADLAERFAADGYECATLHAGWGIEDDAEAARLISSIVEASDRRRIPLYIETHRATIFQDMWRTVGFVRQFPAIRINGDFSHWYTGQEMVYGGFEKKFSFISPVFDRVRFIHGRIGNPGCMQVRVDLDSRANQPYVGHFESLWRACFWKFRSSAGPGECIYFVPELLGSEIYYARTFPNSEGALVEETDRWQQSLVLKQIAENCFERCLESDE